MVTLYNKTKSGAIKQWTIDYNVDHVIITWGLKDGKMQTVVEYGKEKNVGKKNYISKSEDALNIYDRKIEMKKREGYSDKLPSGIDTVDPYVDLPKNIRFYKPKNSITAALKKAKDRVAVRKYDGECFVIQVLENDDEGTYVTMYSRTMLKGHHLEGINPWAARFPKIVRDACKLPAGTILTGELVAPDMDDDLKYIDDREYVARVLKSLTPKALELQDKHLPLHFVVWDCPFFGGKNMSEVLYKDRLLAVSEHLWGVSQGYINEPLVYTIQDGEDLQDYADIAAKENWEGFVIRANEDPAPLFSLTGKVQRSNLCAKLKAEFEDDFIAKWNPDAGEGEYGNGRYTGLFGSAYLYQRDSDGNEVFICKCGNGFTQEFIETNSDVADWPKVLKVKYNARTYISKGDKTNALQFPRMVEIREDKSIVECINEEL